MYRMSQCLSSRPFLNVGAALYATGLAVTFNTEQLKKKVHTI
jgi:hypothetical protein